MSQHKPLDPQRWIFSAPKNAGRDLKDPPGHSFSNERDEQSAVNKGSTTNREILEKQSWELALAPGKSIFMNIFMIWMMGSGSGIFSILMVGYAVLQSFSSLIRVHDVFQVFQSKINTLGQKGLYVVINLVVLGYLCNHAANMGLFPINSGDWVASFPTSVIPESAVRIP